MLDKMMSMTNITWPLWGKKDVISNDDGVNTLYETLLRTASNYPNNTAYEYFKKTVNYKNFLRKVNNCAAAFKATGIKENDVVTICMPNTPEAIITFYALNKIGAVANMIHPLSAENEIKYYLNKSKSVMLISIDFTWEKIKKIIDDTYVKQTVVVPINYSMRLLDGAVYYVLKGRKYKKTPADFSGLYWGEFIHKGKSYVGDVDIKGTKDDVCAILYSGGTSGTPKGIMLTNNNFNSLAEQSLESSNCFNNTDSMLAIMPIFHGFGLGICIHTFVYLGGKIILEPQFSSKTFYKLLIKYKPNAIIGVPTLFEALVTSNKLKNINLNFVKFIISGGDTLPSSLRIRVNEFLLSHNCKVTIREGYGLTECASACCLSPEKIEEQKDNSIGLPYPKTKFKIVEINGQKELKSGAIGEICVNGPTVMKGYLNDEEETKKALQKHSDGEIWLHTGDLGYIDADGYVFFIQRLKRMIISSGYNIYPGQIEKILNEYPGVLTSTVVGIPHQYKMQVVKAYIVLKDGIEPTKKLKESIKKYCALNIAKYAIPYEFEFRNSLPKTKLGKVNYAALEKGENEENKLDKSDLKKIEKEKKKANRESVKLEKKQKKQKNVKNIDKN